LERRPQCQEEAEAANHVKQAYVSRYLPERYSHCFRITHTRTVTRRALTCNDNTVYSAASSFRKGGNR
jgi:hypothetical protein